MRCPCNYHYHKKKVGHKFELGVVLEDANNLKEKNSINNPYIDLSINKSP